ncbi:MAG: DRTGG domain-containing protein, partial [Candidatus Poribacteria bacterium]|nr:DRTGG domain-containing protein [Candidatus Poribacteria bacterium]
IDPGPHYFGRKANKAVILRSGRTDMQLATLETSTSCMVLTGSEAIQPVVLDRAKEKSVPIILTGDELPDVAASIETAIGKSGFNQEKLGRIGELLDQNFDSEQLHKRL